jgi:manganese/iron transport system permease protein
MLFIAVITSTSCSLLGVYLSFFIDSAPAPTIIMVMTLLFMSVFSYQQLSIKIVNRDLKQTRE